MLMKIIHFARWSLIVPLSWAAALWFDVAYYGTNVVFSWGSIWAFVPPVIGGLLLDLIRVISPRKRDKFTTSFAGTALSLAMLVAVFSLQIPFETLIKTLDPVLKVSVIIMFIAVVLVLKKALETKNGEVK